MCSGWCGFPARRSHIVAFLLLLGPLIHAATTRPAVGESYKLYESRHFQLWTDIGQDTARFYLDQAESTLDRFYESAGKVALDPARPPSPLILILFSERPAFHQYLKETIGAFPEWSAGHFSTRTRIVAICHEAPPANPDQPGHGGIALQITVNKARHEIAHQLLDASGILPADLDAPDWLAEGLAILFEESGGPAKTNAHRLRSCQLAEEAGRPLNLHQLLTNSPAGVGPSHHVAEFYAHAWVLTHFLWNQHPAALKSYLKDLRTRPAADPIQQFQKHFGDLPAMERAVHAHLRRLGA